jgi:hypothetical protein
MTARTCAQLLAAALALAACGRDHPPLAGDPPSEPPSFGPQQPGNCEPPDLLFVLDRTLSMARDVEGSVRPDTPEGHDQTKWGQAVRTVHAVTAPPVDATIRFGVVLFPHDPGGGGCLTLSEFAIADTSSNASCEAGDVVVPNGIGQSGAIAAAVDRDTTHLCFSTPIGLALGTARDALAAVASPTRRQFVVLVTDGGETCFTNPGQVVADLLAHGIFTFVVGFAKLGDAAPGDFDAALLDDLACIGGTAPDPTQNCTHNGHAYLGAKSHNTSLFYLAGSGDELEQALHGIAGEVCCGCAR